MSSLAVLEFFTDSDWQVYTSLQNHYTITLTKNNGKYVWASTIPQVEGWVPNKDDYIHIELLRSDGAWKKVMDFPKVK